MSNIHEECGVFGVFSPDNYDVARMTYYGLFSLQHRGQESCGIVVNDDGCSPRIRTWGSSTTSSRPTGSTRSAPAASPSVMCATARPAAMTATTPSRSSSTT